MNCGLSWLLPNGFHASLHSFLLVLRYLVTHIGRREQGYMIVAKPAPRASLIYCLLDQ